MQNAYLRESCVVHFAGFKSDTYQLQRAGWRIAAMEDPRIGIAQIILRHEEAGLEMIASDTRWNPSKMFYGIERYEPPEFVIRHVARAFQVRQASLNLEKFRAIDATPDFVTVKSMNDIRLFGTPLVETEQIIVEPQTVAECLELIRKMQAPDLAAVRKRNADRERQAEIGQKKFHAQILSLAA